MPVNNSDIAAVFEEIADLLDVQGGNPFRVRAYRTAARNIAGLGRGVAGMIEAGEDLAALPGIGKDLAGKMHEIAASGTCAQLAQLREQVPAGVVQLLRLPGLGARRVQTLYRELGVRSLEDLQAAAEAGRVRTLRRFGPNAEQRLLAAARAHLRRDRRFPLAVAITQADALVEALRAVPGVEQAVAAGSVRRMRDTVGDLDLLVTAPAGTAVMQRFLAWHDVDHVLAKGPTRSSVVLRGGLQADLRVVRPQSFGAALLYFTGSRAHNIALRTLAQSRGMKLNEYGLYSGSHRMAGNSEASIYLALGLRYIQPELREDRGEIAAARAARLPRLIGQADLRGDLHVHTEESDGRDSLRRMAEAARAKGLRYLAITDLLRGPGAARGIDPERLARQADRIDALNAELEGIVLLKGVEAGIGEDGSLDIPDFVLRKLELVVGAVHGHFDLPRARQTARLQRAMDHRCFTILAHPASRVLEGRPACDLDMEAVVRHAAGRGCFLELDADPARLALDDIGCRMARDAGVLVSIASGAKSVSGFDNFRLGLGQARRGWLEPAHVLNARPLGELRLLLAATMDRRSHAAALA